MRSASTEVGGTVDKAECSRSKQRGSLVCLCEELDPLAPKVRARCGGSSLLSGHELLEGCSHVSGRGGSEKGLFFRVES